MAKQRDRISEIAVCNFKSIRANQSLTIRPLTVLAGANSAGKSSFLQPLLLVKQTLEAAGDPGALLLDGPNVRFSTSEQVLNRAPGRARTPAFSLRMVLRSGSSLDLIFQQELGRGFELQRMTYASEGRQQVIAMDMSPEQIMEALPEPWKSFPRFVQRASKDLRWTVRRDRCFFGFELVPSHPRKEGDLFGPPAVSPSGLFVPHIQGIIHLPGLRGNPQRTYPKMAGGPHFPGTFEPYVASVICNWQANGGRPNLNELANSLENMGLTWKVKAEPIDDTQVELKVGRLPHARRGGAQDMVSIADVGFGVSQALPVVVALIAAHPGQLVYLEQPEIHLHPMAQRKLAHVLRSAAQREVVAIVETHSALLLRELQTIIARGELSKDQVALHWIERNADGDTTVRTADLDDNGAYGDWPEDFDRTELDAEQAYLDASGDEAR